MRRHRRIAAAAVTVAAVTGIGVTIVTHHTTPGVIVASIPGAFNPNVTQANIATTICVSGWTGTVRPPASYTTALKIKQLRALNYTDRKPADFEEDHLVALGSGGDPTSELNLWPQPLAQAKPDDKLEVQTQHDICAGRITLQQGRQKLIDQKTHHG